MENASKIIELKAIKEPSQVYEQLEARLKKFFRKFIYIPLLDDLDLPKKTIQNAQPSALEDALFKGTISYYRGKFTGNFNAQISKELKELGAKWNRRTQAFELSENQIPTQIKQLILSQQSNFNDKMKKLDQRLAKIIPEELADKFDCADLFDKTLWKVDKDFKENVKHISVAPKLTDYQRQKIANDWQNNMKLYIKDWTQDQIKSLRQQIYDHVISGQRKESLIPPILKITKTIQDSHDEAVNKAKFLAHQETRLMMATFKQARYQEIGSHGYIWRCVHRPHDTSPTHHIPGNVRYSHGLLEGKEFNWNAPPITTNPGEPLRRNHPGTDYNCRCFSRPLIRV